MCSGHHFSCLPEVRASRLLHCSGVFLLSLLALISHAPGGLGVPKSRSLSAFPELPTVDVLALIVFRILYLLIPFALSLLVVLAETHQWRQNQSTCLKKSKVMSTPDCLYFCIARNCLHYG